MGVSQLEAPSVISGACQAAAPSGLPEILALPGDCRARSQQLTPPGVVLSVVCTRVDAQRQAAGEKLLGLPKLLLFEAVQLLFLKKMMLHLESVFPVSLIYLVAAHTELALK